MTSIALGTIRNNFSCFVGMIIQTGSTPMTINALGRFAAPGNTGGHLVKIVDATTGTDLPGGSVSISMAGAATGSFVYASLTTPVNLNPNATYYIMTQETAGADQWYDTNTALQTNPVAAVTGSVYSGANGYLRSSAPAGRAYGPVDFVYVASGSGSPFFITSVSPGTVRNNFTGWVGGTITVGAQPVRVTQLGRYFLAGNTGSHLLKLANASTGADVPGSSVTVSMAGGQPGAFVYAALPSTITLDANVSYYLVSSETAGGDTWYDMDSTVRTNSFAVDASTVYSYTGSTYIVNGSSGHMYGPVDFRSN